MTMRLPTRQLYVLLAIVAIAFGCEQNCCNNPETASLMEGSVQGRWLLVERGYSPGVGYIVDPVPALPAKTLLLSSDGSVLTNIEELNKYHYYQVIDNPAYEEIVLGFFETKPAGTPDLEDLNHSYSVRWEAGKLMLWYRYCFEGCHLGFVQK